MEDELKFQKMLKDLIINSKLNISQIYWILKDTFRDVEQLYMSEFLKEQNKQEANS